MDEARFLSEYEKVSDRLYTFLSRSVNDPDLAADILQEAAFRAFRHRRKFRGDSTFKTWIYRIAVNTMKDQWHRIRRERKWMESEKGEEPGGGLTPEGLYAGRQQAARLTAALAVLEQGYRVPFMLKHVDGMSYGEISKVLGIPEGAARVRVYRARHTLRKILREDQT